jgi:hypothetical protein
MTMYRSAAATLTTCAASLSLAACAAGSTTPSTATTSPAATSRSAAAAAATASASSSASALAGRMLKVSGEVGSFPVPAGAKVVQNIGTSQETIVIFGVVTPAKVSSFYAQALPRAGYTVTANSVITQSGNTVAYIQFTGHGVKGNIDGLSKDTDSTVSLPGLGRKNVTTISLMPK